MFTRSPANSLTPLAALAKCVEVSIEIECDECGAGSLANATTEFGAAKEFYNDGWRVNEGGFAVCRRCAGGDSK